MTINEMKNAIIEEYGFEHPVTIEFFRKCEEDADEETLSKVYGGI